LAISTYVLLLEVFFNIFLNVFLISFRKCVYILVIFKDLWWFFVKEKKNYILSIGILIVMAIIHLLPPYGIRVIVDGIKNNVLDFQTLLKWLVLIFISGIVTYFLGYLWRVLLFGSAAKLGRVLRQKLYIHFTMMSPSFFSKYRIGDLLAHSTNDIQALVMTAGEGVLMLTDAFITACTALIPMFFIDKTLTFICILPTPLMAISTRYYGSLMYRRFMKSQEAFSKMNNKVREDISGIKVIKAFGRESVEIAKFKKLMHEVFLNNFSVAKVDALFDPTILLVAGFSYILSLVFGVFFIKKGVLSIGQLIQFTLYLGFLIWPMLAFGWLFNIVERGNVSYKRIQKIFSVKPLVTDSKDAVAMPFNHNIEFKLKSFCYPDSKEVVLKDIYLSIAKGQIIGIVGKTGSGKTTFLRLLLREFETKDSIFIAGIPIEKIRLKSLRSAIGYVPQDHVLFNTTIAENIAFGKPSASLEEIITASKLSHFNNDVLKFKDGYNTVIGEQGCVLSGGQKQRLALARALLLDPPILLLDDPLSAVDAKTERDILSSLYKTREGKTTIIATHRISVVEKAAKILVLKDGKIVSFDTHDNLLLHSSWYKEMALKQSLEKKLKEDDLGDKKVT